MDVNADRLHFCKDWLQLTNTLEVKDKPEKRLAAMTDGDLPTVVFDATGNAASMNHAFHYAAHSGKVIFVGLVKDTIEFF